jgi:putative protease
MPDLKKIFFFPKNKNYVDVTRLPLKKKKRISLRKSILSKLHFTPAKIKKVKHPKPLEKKNVRKSLKPLKPLKKTALPKKLRKMVNPPKAAPKVIVEAKARKPILKAPKEVLAGEVTHFFDKIQVCVVKVKKPLKVGDKLHFIGKALDFIQVLDSMQIDHQQVMTAKKGDEIGLKISSEVQPGDKVFLL